jgi:hypothetical protein
MKQQMQLFLSAEDETVLSNSLFNFRPELAYLDGNRWISSTPKVVTSINNCTSSHAYLWDRSIIPKLPYFSRDDRQFEGPQSGCVLEIRRSRIQGNLMLAGRFAQSVENSDPLVIKAMHVFVADVWKLLKSVTKHPLVAVDPLCIKKSLGHSYQERLF